MGTWYRSPLANGLLFNLSWLLIVTTHSLWVAPLVMVVHLAVHRILFSFPRGEWRLFLAIACGGLLLDQALFATGILKMDTHWAFGTLWLSFLWPVLATTLNHAFGFLQGRPSLSALLGGIGGMLSYSAGVRLSPISFGEPLLSVIALGLLWALLMPALLYTAQKFAEPDGVHVPFPRPWLSGD